MQNPWIWILRILKQLACASVLPFLATSYGYAHVTSYPTQKKPPQIWTSIRANFKLIKQPENARLGRSELHIFLRNKTSLHHVLLNAAPFLFYVYKETQQLHIPAEMALIPYLESNYIPYGASDKGAVGLWQLMPGTASGMHIPISWWFDGRRDLADSTFGALMYFKQLHTLFGSWPLALAAYNAGPRPVYAALRHSHSKSVNYSTLHLPRATHYYAPHLFALAMIINNPKKYGVVLPNIPDKPFLIPVQLQRTYNVNHLAKMAKISTEDFRLYNAGFRRWATPPPGHHYRIWVPLNHAAAFYKAMHVEEKQQATSIQGNWVHYSVVLGDNLSRLAARYHVSTAQIKEANHLRSNLLHLGQPLLIPPAHTQLTLQHHPVDATISEDHAPGPQLVLYRTQWGDNLSHIAQRFAVSSRAIRYWNNLKPSTVIHNGMNLQLWVNPNEMRRSTTVRYKVKPGDTLSLIASRFRTNVKQITWYNGIHQQEIHVGQTLKIPVPERWTRMHHASHHPRRYPTHKKASHHTHHRHAQHPALHHKHNKRPVKQYVSHHANHHPTHKHSTHHPTHKHSTHHPYHPTAH